MVAWAGQGAGATASRRHRSVHLTEGASTVPMPALRAALLVLACAAVPAFAPPAAAQEATAAAEELGSRALELANAARTKAGLPALAPSAVLDEAARAHAEDMLERGFYDHVTPEGRTARDRYEAAGGAPWAVSGENIARCTGCPTPPGPERVEAFHTGWMQSPGHRENVLSPGYERFGFAVVGAEDETYAVQTFAGPGGQGGEAEATDPAALRTAVLEEINARRRSAELDPLTSDPALDAVAAAALDAVLSEDALPTDPFGLLPEGASGWTSMGLRASSRGGAGPALMADDAADFVEAMAEEAAEPLGGIEATHLGVAARADGTGRKTAVAVFGGRG